MGIAGIAGIATACLTPAVAAPVSSTDSLAPAQREERQSGPVRRENSTAPAVVRAEPSRLLVARRVTGGVFFRRGGHSSPLSAGTVLLEADAIETAAGAAVVLELTEAVRFELGEKTRLVADRPSVSETQLLLEAGTLRIDAGDVPAHSRLTVVLADLRFHLGPGEFLFEHLTGPTSAGTACVFAGTAALDSPRGAAGQLRDGQCVALERLGASGPILLRSIAVSGHRKAPASPPSSGSSAAAREPLPVVNVPAPVVGTAGGHQPLAGPAPQDSEPMTSTSPNRSSDGPPVQATSDEDADSPRSERGLPRWIVNVASFSGTTEAEGVVDQLREAGFKVLLREEQVQGRPSYRAVITGFQTEEEARAAVERLSRDYGYQMAWTLRSR